MNKYRASKLCSGDLAFNFFWICVPGSRRIFFYVTWFSIFNVIPMVYQRGTIFFCNKSLFDWTIMFTKNNDHKLFLPINQWFFKRCNGPQSRMNNHLNCKLSQIYPCRTWFDTHLWRKISVIFPLHSTQRKLNSSTQLNIVIPWIHTDL